MNFLVQDFREFMAGVRYAFASMYSGHFLFRRWNDVAIDLLFAGLMFWTQPFLTAIWIAVCFVMFMELHELTSRMNRYWRGRRPMLIGADGKHTPQFYREQKIDLAIRLAGGLFLFIGIMGNHATWGIVAAVAMFILAMASGTFFYFRDPLREDHLSDA